MMANEIHPLFALAESLASPKEIKSKLHNVAAAAAEAAYDARLSELGAKRNVVSSLDSFIEGHFFSGFGKKKTLDKVIATSMKGYRKKLKELLLQDIRELKSEDPNRFHWNINSLKNRLQDISGPNAANA